MSDALEVLLSLCRCLRASDCPNQQGGPGELPVGPDRWDAVIELANAEFLTPALWASLQAKGLEASLPEDARGFLAEAHRRNAVRNTRIRGQALELLKAMTAARIKAVVLKGGVHLFEEDQSAFETRMMIDLDILVPEDCLQASFELAKGLGYQTMIQSDQTFHHLEPLGRKGELASVEIHRDVGMQRRILPAASVLLEAQRLSVPEAAIYVPTRTHRIIHHIFHAEVQTESAYAQRRISVRHLHEFAMLRRGHEAEIDWYQVQQGLTRQGYGDVVSGHLYLAERLLGLPMPEGVPVTPSARRHHRRCLAQVKWPILRRAVNAVAIPALYLRRPWIEYLYGESGNALDLQINRLRYLAFLLLSRRKTLPSRLAGIVVRMWKLER